MNLIFMYSKMIQYIDNLESGILHTQKKMVNFNIDYLTFRHNYKKELSLIKLYV